MNAWIVVAGALVGWGVWRVWRGIFPQRPALADVLALPALRMAPTPILAAPRPNTGPFSWLGRHSQVATRLVPTSLDADLRIVQKSREQHIGEKVGLAVLGFLAPSLMMSVALVVGAAPPVVPLTVVGTVLAAAGFVAPDLAVRASAAERRREFDHGLRAFIRGVSSELAGGSGLDDALYECARTGLPDGELDGPPVRIGEPGWVLQHIFAALHLGRLARQPSSAALRQLAGELDARELTVVASKVAQSEAEGARARESFEAMARSLSVKVNHREMRKANAVSEAMTGPLMLVLASLIMVLLFPAGYHLISGLQR